MNFVYSKDVADLIINISGVVSNSPVDPKTLFLSYNIACEESITLPDFLDQIVYTDFENKKFIYLGKDFKCGVKD